MYLLCGNAHFEVRRSFLAISSLFADDFFCQLAAHSLSIDRKLKTRLESKTMIAMRLLRSHWHSLFLAKMKNPALPLTDGQGVWLEMLKEALCSPPPEEEVRKKKGKSEPIQIGLVRNA